jgi:hypothetical protein
MNMVVDHGDVARAAGDNLAEHVVHHGRFRAGRRDVVRERAHANRAEPRARARIVALQGECAVAEEPLSFHAGRNHRRRRLGVVHQQRSVQPHLNVLAAHGHLYLEPLVVGGELLVDVADSVERPGLLAFDVAALARGRVVELNLEASLRPAFRLMGRVEVDAGVGARL